MRASEPSWVEVDYLRLWAVVGGRSELVQENSYSDGRLGGTLASRDEWFKFRWDELQQRATVTNGIVRFTWEAIPGRTYRVEFKNDLSEPNWAPLGVEISPAGTTASATNAISTGQRFYRVELLQ